MARTKIVPGKMHSTYEDCPKVMLKAALEKQRWFFNAVGRVKISSSKEDWLKRNTNPAGTVCGSDPYELEIRLMHEGIGIDIIVRMNADQGFEIRMGRRQEVRRGDGSLVVWYSNNIEGAVERVRRHFVEHGEPYAEKEKEANIVRNAEKELRKQKKIELEKELGVTLGKEKYGSSFVFEQGSFALAFRYEERKRRDDYVVAEKAMKIIKLTCVSSYFTMEEFKEFLAFVGTRPRLVAERLKGIKGGIRIEGRE